MAWAVHTKGGPNRTPFEIAVVWEGNSHGIASYGWFNEDKLLISHNGGPCRWPVTERVWAGLVALAEQVAEEMNG